MHASGDVVIEVIAKDWMKPGFVGFSVKGEGPLDTHYFMLTPTDVIDLGRPRDLFPKLVFKPIEYRRGWSVFE